MVQGIIISHLIKQENKEKKTINKNQSITLITNFI